MTEGIPVRVSQLHLMWIKLHLNVPAMRGQLSSRSIPSSQSSVQFRPYLPYSDHIYPIYTLFRPCLPYSDHVYPIYIFWLKLFLLFVICEHIIHLEQKSNFKSLLFFRTPLAAGSLDIGAQHLNKTAGSLLDIGAQHLNKTAGSLLDIGAQHLNKTAGSLLDIGAQHLNKTAGSLLDIGAQHLNKI